MARMTRKRPDPALNPRIARNEPGSLMGTASGRTAVPRPFPSDQSPARARLNAKPYPAVSLSIRQIVVPTGRGAMMHDTWIASRNRSGKNPKVISASIS